MKKDFIKDGYRIRKCDSNISKMNIIGFSYCYVFHWGYFRRVFECILECIEGLVKYGPGLLYNLIALIFTPLTLIICSVIEIKEAKERCLINKR